MDGFRLHRNSAEIRFRQQGVPRTIDLYAESTQQLDAMVQNNLAELRTRQPRPEVERVTVIDNSGTRWTYRYQFGTFMTLDRE